MYFAYLGPQPPITPRRLAGDGPNTLAAVDRHLRSLRTPDVRRASGARRRRQRCGRRRGAGAGAARRARVPRVREAAGRPARAVASAREDRSRLVPPHFSAEPTARPANASHA